MYLRVCSPVGGRLPRPASVSIDHTHWCMHYYPSQLASESSASTCSIVWKGDATTTPHQVNFIALNIFRPGEAEGR